MTRLCFPLGLTLCAILALAAPVGAQQSLEQHTQRLGALGAWHAAQHAATPPAAAPFVVTAYAFEFLDSSQQTPSYMVFLDGTLTYSNGRLAEEITRTPDFLSGGTGLVNQTRTTYTYTGGHVAQSVSYQWTNSAWVPEGRTSFSYNGSGQMLSTTSEEYDAATSTWENRYRTTFTYAGGIPKTVIDEGWTGTAWMPEFRSTITGSGNTTVLVEESWNGAQWVNDLRTTFNASVQDLLAAQTALETILATPLFVFVPPDRATAEAFYAITYTEEDWDVTANAWVNSERVRVTVDNATTLQVVEETWNSLAWESTSRTTLTFNGQRVTENLQETSPDGTTFVAEMKTKYTYDTNSNPVLVELFADDDGNGTLDATASSRIRFTWTDLGTGTAIDGEVLAEASRLTRVAPSPVQGRAEVGVYLDSPVHATVRVFDALGREVATLADQPLSAGSHAFTLDATSLANGVYVVRLDAGPARSTHTLVVAR